MNDWGGVRGEFVGGATSAGVCVGLARAIVSREVLVQPYRAQGVKEV